MGELLVEDVTVRYGDVVAVDDVSLTVPPATVLAVLGPSGCGKSTLLRTIVGLENPTSGSIVFDGVDQAGIPVHRRGFGLMFQDGQLFDHLSVLRNVVYGLRRQGVDRRTANARGQELLGVVGLAGYADRAPSTLSGGERQRVALARALAPEPSLLLLDEPLSALDRSLRVRLATDLRRILRETETTAVMVTHDHEEAFAVADEVAIMRRGEIIQRGTPRDVWSAPLDADAAEFLGYARVVSGVGLETLRAAYDGALPAGSAVAVRQNAFRVGDGPLAARVQAVAPSLDELRLIVELADGTELDAVAGLGDTLSPGDEVALVLDGSAVAAVPD